jgi:hypothetical protein
MWAWDHRDRAARVPYTMFADRAQHHALDDTLTPCADHEEVRATSGIDQQGTGSSMQDAGRSAHLRRIGSGSVFHRGSGAVKLPFVVCVLGELNGLVKVLIVVAGADDVSGRVESLVTPRPTGSAIPEGGVSKAPVEGSIGSESGAAPGSSDAGRAGSASTCESSPSSSGRSVVVMRFRYPFLRSVVDTGSRRI